MQAKKLASGTILRGEYVLLGVIGDGNSNVFRAHHRRDNRLVAVRIQQLDPGPASANSLDLPNRALRVRDPMLAAVETTGQTKEGFFFIVSEYVAGQRMDQWADKVGIPPLGVVTEIIQKVSNALHLLHREGIAHGAVNPRNLVLLRSDSAAGTATAKLLDIGVPAYMRARPPRLRSSYFMAPEQLAVLLRGEEAVAPESNPRMDVYACGCLLYHLCTGGAPFQGRSLGELIAAHTSEKLLPPSRINPRIPAALEAVILRALANDPEERHENGGALAAALAEMRRTSSVSGVILRPPAASGREPTREAPLELGEIFTDFQFEERPTSQIQIDETAETVPPPPGEFADETPAMPAPKPPTGARASSAPRRSSVPPVTPPQVRGSVVPPLMPSVLALPEQSQPLAAAIANEAERAARASVPAGSFSSAPPSGATNRLSVPFRPAPRALRSPFDSPESASDAAGPELDALLDIGDSPEPPKPLFLRVLQLDRRWLALPLACLALLVGVWTLRAPPEDTVTVSPLESYPEPAPNAARPAPSAPAPSAQPALRSRPTVAVAPPSAPTRQALNPRQFEAQPAPRAAPAWHVVPQKPAPVHAHAGSAKAAAPVTALKVPAAFKSIERLESAPPAPNEEPAQRAELAAEPEPESRVVEKKPEPEPEVQPEPRSASQVPVASAVAAEKPKPEDTPRPVVLAANAQIAELSVRGSLASGEVRRALERVQGTFPACYAKAARAAGRNAFGELAVELTIDENGRAQNPSASGSPLPGLNACVAQATAKLVSSRKPDTGTVKATFKVSFAQKTP